MYDNRKQSGVQEDCSSTPCLPKGSVGLLVKFALRVDVGSFHIITVFIFPSSYVFLYAHVYVGMCV